MARRVTSATLELMEAVLNLLKECGGCASTPELLRYAWSRGLKITYDQLYYVLNRLLVCGRVKSYMRGRVRVWVAVDAKTEERGG